jgi:hypothetical protein
MAKATTIAVLDIDEKGAVKAVDKTTASMDRMGKQGDELARKVQEPTRRISRFSQQTADFGNQAKRTESTMGTLVAKLFDLKGALIAVGGSIGLVFVLLQIGMMLREVGTRLVSNIEAWQTFKTVLDDTWRKLVEGETIIDRINRKLQELADKAGVALAGGPTFAQKLKDALALYESLVEQRGLLLHQAGPTMGFIEREFGQLLSATDLANIKASIEALPKSAGDAALRAKELDVAIENTTRALFALQEQTGLTVAEFDKLYGTDLENAAVRAVRVVEQYTGEVRNATEAIEKAARLPMPFFDAAVYRDFVELGPALWEPVVAYGNAWREVGEIWEQDIIPGFLELRFLSDDLSDAFYAVGDAASAAGAMIGAAARAGVVSQSVAARLMMAILAVQATQKGMIEVAEAAAAAARFDPVSATLHGIAAGLYFAAAGFNFAGAVSGGSGNAAGTGIGGLGVTQLVREGIADGVAIA